MFEDRRVENSGDATVGLVERSDKRYEIESWLLFRVKEAFVKIYKWIGCC